MKISYSAPGKVILSGEHSVVYGKPALVSAINLLLTFTIYLRSYKDSKQDGEIMFSSHKVKEYLKKQNIKFVDKPFDYKIESEIPVGRGLGSSAALSVTTVAAFLEFYIGKEFDKKIVNNLAFQIEKYFHTNPSGVDNSASCFGGLILYKKNAPFNKLNLEIPKNFQNKLFLIDSGKPEETTGEMVKLVKSVISNQLKSVESVESVKTVFNRIENETEKILDAIENKNVDEFKESIFKNEKLLEELDVISEKTKKLLKELSQFGVGKTTGAGGKKEGSGFILFYADDKEKLINYLDERKIKYYKFEPDSKGLIRI
jgi:mevalonate kinase